MPPLAGAPGPSLRGEGELQCCHFCRFFGFAGESGDAATAEGAVLADPPAGFVAAVVAAGNLLVAGAAAGAGLALDDGGDATTEASMVEQGGPEGVADGEDVLLGGIPVDAEIDKDSDGGLELGGDAARVAGEGDALGAWWDSDDALGQVGGVEVLRGADEDGAGDAVARGVGAGEGGEGIGLGGEGGGGWMGMGGVPFGGG